MRKITVDREVLVALVTAARKVIDEFGTSSESLQELFQTLKLYTSPPTSEDVRLARKPPLPYEHDLALCEAYCNQASDMYFKARPQLDSDVNRRIFYAGHRKAWIERESAHGIKEAP